MVTIIVVAAGSGSRFGSAVPKQFCNLAGRPVVMHTIDALRAALPEARIVLVISPSETDRWDDLCRTNGFDSPIVVHGGDSRWQSVRNALRVVGLDGSASDDDIIMVHDGARPLVSAPVVARLIDAMVASGVGGAIPVVPVTDSLRRVGGDGRSVAVDRSQLRAVQTPQAFRARLLCDAYALPYSPLFTDDASVMEQAGYSSLVLTEGDPCNIKITNPLDIAIAETILARS